MVNKNKTEHQKKRGNNNMQYRDAVRVVVNKSPKIKKTVDRVTKWDKNKTLADNAKVLFNSNENGTNSSYVGAFQFAKRFELVYKQGKRGRPKKKVIRQTV